MLLLKLVFAFLGFLTPLAHAAFGYTSDSTHFTVDANSANPLIFKVAKANGDITSILYRGVQLQQQSPYSHINSGLGTATVSASTIGSYVKITVVASGLTQYYVVRDGDSTIFMATYVTAHPSVGELRFIARLESTYLPSAEYLGADTSSSTSTVEGSDVFIVNGQTRSKFYSSERFIDDEVHCIYGTDAKACMVIPDPTAYETSAGGPFMRDINYNNGGDYHALYWYMNSGHVRTEDARLGLHGPYALVFSRSGEPSGSLDTSFFSTLGISGYVPTASRGYVSGTATGIPSGFQTVLHWYNSAAQYWTYASSSGTFTSPPMKPGTYTMVLYKDELKVATKSVTVSAGSTTASGTIASTEGTRSTVWRIGEFNGRPTGFRNADNQLRMHPTDSRMASWGPLTYTVGSSGTDAFPMAQVVAVNNPTTIKFSTTSISGTFILRIGTTLAFAGARPSITVNGWSSSTPAAPTKIDSRGLTRGAYRGYGESYDYTIPSGTIVSGTNTITINAVSGSSGDMFLSPNFIYDAVELFKS
ncbi:putative rhamnogalacturonate lyase A [Morchella conica CCBAS932]|uniref:Rhamnogalacturonate lyase n=1 Tax=Morchella conica CCBAS932 TaxID=1392247 RepID=A0A3N4LFF4_9PEZI|nr:putative rhamnogalacturonate lyase A [Morchella conica CCBAS932]